MPAHDPTSVSYSLPSAPNQQWTVDDVARLQQREMPEPAESIGAAPAGPPAAAASPPASGLPVSGRYRSSGPEVELELRVDIDGVRPTRRVSGDFFHRTGGTVTYTGSFVVTAPHLAVADGTVTIEGEATDNFESGSPRLHLTIPISEASGPQSTATAQFLTTDGRPGAAYSCTYESAYFRTLEFEQDFVADITPFGRYDTARLVSGGPPRVLTVPSAYAEAGIEMRAANPGDLVPLALSGRGSDLEQPRIARRDAGSLQPLERKPGLAGVAARGHHPRGGREPQGHHVRP